MNNNPIMPATTAAPIVPPETPLSDELDVVAGCALPLLVPVLCVPVAVGDPEALLLVDVDAIASLLKSVNWKTLLPEQLASYDPQLFCVAHVNWKRRK